MTSSHKPVKVMATRSNLTIEIMKMAGHHNIAAAGRHDARDATRTLATPASARHAQNGLRHYAEALQHRALRTGPVKPGRPWRAIPDLTSSMSVLARS